MHVANITLSILAASAAAGTPAQHSYIGGHGLVRLDYSGTLMPEHDFGGKPLMSPGWRVMWDIPGPGPGEGVVTFAQDARPSDGQGVVTELIQIGMSRDAVVVSHCGTAGLVSENGGRKQDRILGGRRWTVYGNVDAGMSQMIGASDLRTVVDGICYAVDRVTYLVEVAPELPVSAPTQVAAAARMDAILESVRVGRPR